MQVFDFSGEYSLYTVFKLLYGGFMKNHLISSLKHLFVAAAVFFLLLPLCSCNQSCSLENSGKTPVSSLSVLNWNVETFFDANFDGTEYSDFKSSTSTWNESKYIKRLERVAEVIKASDCDVIIMEELEKKGQLFDIYNRLCSSFIPALQLRYFRKRRKLCNRNWNFKPLSPFKCNRSFSGHTKFCISSTFPPSHCRILCFCKRNTSFNYCKPLEKQKRRGRTNRNMAEQTGKPSFNENRKSSQKGHKSSCNLRF